MIRRTGTRAQYRQRAFAVASLFSVLLCLVVLRCGQRSRFPVVVASSASSDVFEEKFSKSSARFHPFGLLETSLATIDANDRRSRRRRAESDAARATRRRTANADDASARERQALLRFYNETRGDQWFRSDGWSSPWDNADYCQWFGVVCASSSFSGRRRLDELARVTELRLPNNNVAGGLAALWDLPRLRRLSLRQNPINDLGLKATSGGGGDGTASSIVLEALDVTDCLLSSVDGLDRASGTLRELRAAGNPAVGHLQSSNSSVMLVQLLSMPQIEVLDMSSCQIKLDVASLFSSRDSSDSATAGSKSLQELVLHDNLLGGSIPPGIGRWTKLRVLDMSSNQLTGTLPSELERLTELQSLNLQQQGRAVTGRGSAEPSGAITGRLLSFASSPYLSNLLLADNDLTGQIPDNLLQSYGNSTSTNDDAATGDNEDGSTRGVTIDVSYNRLNGTLPDVFAARFSNLTLIVVGNALEGPVPDEYCSRQSWMQGSVAELGCSAVACPAGTYSPGAGRAVDAQHPCQECNETLENGSQIVGATTCGGPKALPEPVILAQLFNATGGQDGSWIRSDGWQELINDVAHAYGDVATSSTNSSSFSVSLCKLYGVLCNSQGQVSMITLSKNGLGGTLPPSLFQLPHLTSLDVSENLIEVEDWTALEAATVLTHLKVSRTRISTLEGVSRATQLAELSAGGNSFHSGVLPELFEMANLVDLRLEASFLTGTIPSELNRLTNLKKLHLHENQLHGELPACLASLSQLEELDLSSNSLNGTLPIEWNSFSRLVTLRINGNNRERGLSGKLIAFSGLERIETLELSNQAFEGSIPSDLLSGRSRDGSLRVNLSKNRLTGSVPSNLGAFGRLFLELEGNLITELPEELCQDQDWMGGEIELVPDPCDAILCPPGTWSALGRSSSKSDTWCTPCENATFFGSTSCHSGEQETNREAEILDLLYVSTRGPWWKKPHYNWTKPSIPICYREGIRCVGNDPNSGVVEVYLNEFGLRGSIPDEIFDLPELRLLGISFNDVDISFKNVGKASKLQSLLASATRAQSFSGIENAGENLLVIHLAKNGIKGTFPSEILYLGGLRALFLNENLLSGTLPKELGIHMKGLGQLMLENNRFVGYLPSELGLLRDLTHLNVQGNLLSGLIPQSFSNLFKIEDVNLSNQKSVKKFTGPVLAFESNPALTRIDLSGNSFAGTLPHTFMSSAKRDSRIYANFSRNELRGAVPESLDSFQMLDLDLSANLISFLPASLCDNSDWMSGIVGMVHPDEACNAILCRPGTFSSSGRQTHANAPCQECERDDEAPFYGSTTCDDTPMISPCVIEVADGGASCSNEFSERSALELLFASTWGGGWTNNTGWMTDGPICSWVGVICGGDTRDDAGVIALSLANNGLAGSFPSELWSLPSLKQLSLNENPELLVPLDEMPGSLKVESLILHGSQVRHLDRLPTTLLLREFSFSGQSGPFPTHLLKLPKLERLNLDENHFVGTLPTDWSKAKHLKVLSATGNDFHGALPGSLLRVKGIEEIVLDDNLLSGVLPVDDLAAASSLRVLSIARENKSGRKITGGLPTFANKRLLESVSLRANELTGSIPSDFLSGSPNLLYVDLRDNQLTGGVPDTLVSRSSDLYLTVSGNRFESLPDGSCDIHAQLSNESRGESPPCSELLCSPGTWSPSGGVANSTAACSQCPANETTPYYGSTSCSYESPDAQIHERSVLVELFEACGGRNWYRRDLWLGPTTVCDWHGVGCSSEGRVVVVNLQRNNLACDVPPSLFRLASLEKLDLGSNRISVDFSTLSDAYKTNLRELRLANTQVSSLSGIGRLDGLAILVASFSNLTGSLPANDVSALSNLRVLSLGGNELTGPLETAVPSSSVFAELKYLRILRLDKNEFSGPLPSFADMETLVFLSLSGNRLNGTIPADFLRGRSPDSSALALTIDLADNALEGTVPEELARFSNATLLLAGNRLESLPDALCSRAEWNHGDVGRYGCDALLCPPRTSSPTGRRSSGDECRPCPHYKRSEAGEDGTSDSQSYLGQRACPGTVDTSRAPPGARSAASVVALAAAAAWATAASIFA